MSTVINTNLASLFAQNSLSNAQNNLATSVQRLSSGLRINSAKDDAAGLAISQNMQSQLNGTNQSIQNLNNATNLLQTADSSLSTIQDMLLRMKQLATQGYDGSLNPTQMSDIVQQMNQLNSEINATASRTQFNGINLIGTGSFVNNKTSGVFAGQALVYKEPSVTSVDGSTTATAVNPAGFTALGTSGSLTLPSSTSYAVGGVTTPATATYTLAFDSSVDPSIKRQFTNGAYTLTAIGNNVTLDYTDSTTGIKKQQTLDVSGAVADTNTTGGTSPTNAPTTYNLAFTQFGLDLNVQVTPATNKGPTILASDVASALNQRSFTVGGQSSQLTDVQLAGAASGRYQLTASGSPSHTFTAMVTTASTTASNTAATEAITFNSIKAGDQITIGTTSAGITFTATKDISANQLAADFKNYYTQGVVTAYSLSNGDGVFSANTLDSTWKFTAANSAATVGTGANANVLTLSSTTTATPAELTTTLSPLKPGQLTLSWNTYDSSGNANAHSQAITLLDSQFTAGTDSTINFDAAGISFKIHNYQSQTGAQVATELAGLISNQNNISSNLGNTGAGILDVINPGTTKLDFQSGPSSESFISINTLNVMTASSGQYTGSSSDMLAVGTSMNALSGFNGSTQTTDWQGGFQNASAAIDKAIDYISTQRSVFGSQMNRLSFVTTNLTAQSTNLQSSRSAIIDTNFASETATLTKGQIMQQAATAMLAQANQMPNVILSLLK